MPMLAPEGKRPVLFFAPAAVLAALTLGALAGCLLGAAAVFLAWFFRDPERTTPEGAEAWVSPADGRVTEIRPSEHPFTGESTVVGVFMSPLVVHVNRMPVDGTVAFMEYVPGKKLMAFNPKASLENERFYMGFETRHGRGMTVQVAGILARRITCSRKKGDVLTRGERFGMIKLGSKVDLYLPEGVSPVVTVGAKVKAGKTAIGVRK